MNRGKRLDRVTIFGQKLSFLIPHEWEESDEDGDYLYHKEGTESGWLRVSLLTVKADSETPGQKLKTFFDGRPNVVKEQNTGNLICSYEEDSEQNGVPIYLYYWLVANMVPPDLVREAIFSYTVLRSRKDEEDTKETVELLKELLSVAQFCPPN